jgi:hypothetical protein
MAREAYGAEQARKMNNSLADDPDDRNWDAHIKRVQQDAALKAPRRTVAPDLCGGPPRPLLDKLK